MSFGRNSERFSPTRGTVPPSISGTPQRRQYTPNVAPRSTTRRSHHRASSRPPATALPATAAITGSSYLRLNPVLQWFTGNIGLHHVHHLGPRIPNYRLQRVHDENPVFNKAHQITLVEGVKALRLALWDEQARRMIPFKELRRLRATR